MLLINIMRTISIKEIVTMKESIQTQKMHQTLRTMSQCHGINFQTHGLNLAQLICQTICKKVIIKPPKTLAQAELEFT